MLSPALPFAGAFCSAISLSSLSCGENKHCAGPEARFPALRNSPYFSTLKRRSRVDMAIPSAVVHDFGVERRPYTCPRRKKCPISWGNRAFCMRFRNQQQRDRRVFSRLLTKANGRFTAINGCANALGFARCAAQSGQALPFDRIAPRRRKRSSQPANRPAGAYGCETCG